MPGYALQVGYQIKTRVQELGHGCIYMVQKAGALQLSPTDSFSKRELIECARAVTEKVSFVDGNWCSIFNSCSRKLYIYLDFLKEVYFPSLLLEVWK